jgi:deoxyribonuclease V
LTGSSGRSGGRERRKRPPIPSSPSSSSSLSSTARTSTTSTNNNTAAAAAAIAIQQQKDIAKRVIARDDHGPIRLVCGVDVSYRAGMAYCSAVVMDMADPNVVVEQTSTKSEIKYPYIPGLFILREADPILRTLKRLEHYDLVLVDGHGLLHPRRCGLACYIGVVKDKPTIGAAKSLLCGSVRENDNYVELGGEVLGYRLTIKGRRKALYISVGHRISLESAIAVVRQMIKKGEWLPEPLRLADTYSKLLRE